MIDFARDATWRKLENIYTITSRQGERITFIKQFRKFVQMKLRIFHRNFMITSIVSKNVAYTDPRSLQRANPECCLITANEAVLRA